MQSAECRMWNEEKDVVTFNPLSHPLPHSAFTILHSAFPLLLRPGSEARRREAFEERASARAMTVVRATDDEQDLHPRFGPAGVFMACGPRQPSNCFIARLAARSSKQIVF